MRAGMEIRLRRLLARMPRHALAKETGITWPRLRAIEEGWAEPDASELEKLRAFFEGVEDARGISWTQLTQV